ncbi:MAG: hypothetical protein RIC87_01005 [Kiloniellales bacterium]
MSIVHDSLKPSSSLYASGHGAPLYASRWAPPRQDEKTGRRVFAWVKECVRRWHDARVRSARLHSLALLDKRTLHDIGYMHGDIVEAREILAARYRDRLGS